MKLKNLFPLAAAFALPLSIVSCGDDKKEEEKDAASDSTSADQMSHKKIGEGIDGMMLALMGDMSSIKDLESAQGFASKFAKHKEVLLGLLKKAKALDPPTEDEKSAIQKMKDATDEKGDKMQKAFFTMMGSSPDAEKIGEALGVMQDKEFNEAMKEIEKIYDLKDGPKGDDPESK